MATIYIDELFLINFAINYILLYITKRIIKVKPGRGMLAISSIIGAFYTILMFLPSLEFMYGMAGKVIFTLALVAITYRVKNVADYLKAFGAFMVVNFAFAGAIYAFMNLTGNYAMFDGGIYYNLPLRLICTSAIFAYVCLAAYGYYVRRRGDCGAHIATVGVKMGSDAAAFCCLVDSGNTLRDPLSAAPVVVLEYDKIKKILPTEICKVIECRDDIFDGGGVDGLSSSMWRSRLRLIPYKSLGSDGGLLIGFRPDALWVKNDSGVKSADVIIGVYRGTLSADNSYCGLISPDIAYTK